MSDLSCCGDPRRGLRRQGEIELPRQNLLVGVEHDPDEYLNNDLKQTIKNKPRAKTRDDLVDPQIDPETSGAGQVILPRKACALRCLSSHLFA